MEESCCTCATVLSDVPRFRQRPTSDDQAERFSEKQQVPLPVDRRLVCCARIICGRCLDKNARFATYCPYCQISTGPSSLPPAGLKEPPSYGSAANAAARRLVAVENSDGDDGDSSEPLPPPYTTTVTVQEKQQPPPPATPCCGADEKKTAAAAAGLDHCRPDPPPPPEQQDGVLHFLDHTRDTVASLSLRYGVPRDALRRANRLGSDHLLLGRRVILIPALSSSFSAAAAAAAATTTAATTEDLRSRRPPPLTSLSPNPVEGEDEERRKGRIRRWMVACKEADYDVALLYLEQAGYDVDAAAQRYFADEAWERENPVVTGANDRRGGRGGSSITRMKSAASSSSSSARPRGRLGLGFGSGPAGEGGWMWAAQAPFLRRSRQNDLPGST